MEKAAAEKNHPSLEDEDIDHDGVFSSKELDLDGSRDPVFTAIRSRGAAALRPQSLHPVRSHRSYGGEDGYSCHRGSIEGGPETSGVEDDRFTVRFSGDNDPDSPRSRSRFRKWVVVLIMAGSALNVYVGGRFGTILLTKNKGHVLHRCIL